MKKLGSKGIKVLKILHLIFAMIWTSGAIAMVLITFLSKAQSVDELHMKYSILLVVDNWLIITGAMTSLVIGIVYGIFTNWGFFKHRWIIVKWIITVAQILFGTFAYHPALTQNLSLISELKEEVVFNAEFIANNRFMEISGFFQSGLLLFMIVISVFKPWKAKKR
ncbi:MULTISPECIES: hypothetical protein [unclassified Dysgonomonas]|uniref:hypothetical protein n=1 Tax=unclassified Dysgonomonas TaxID=2630389 RepID=UPI000681276A|nr:MULTISPECIES: hypothetical protein [unclassified Dysgonomonas]MBD8349010.1 hypothetical protein [Dysgonomonas sp. HGC4]MBF0576471.1 hypothetical protein [Dysgonomonas sp. GY617]